MYWINLLNLAKFDNSNSSYKKFFKVIIIWPHRIIYKIFAKLVLKSFKKLYKYQSVFFFWWSMGLNAQTRKLRGYTCVVVFLIFSSFIFCFFRKVTFFLVKLHFEKDFIQVQFNFLHFFEGNSTFFLFSYNINLASSKRSYSAIILKY